MSNVDRYLNRLAPKFQSGFLESPEMQKTLVSVEPKIVLAAIWLVVMFLRQNTALGRYARSHATEHLPLARNELDWLQCTDGAWAFLQRHRTIVSYLRREFSQEELLAARLIAQIVLFHSNDHCALAQLGGEEPGCDLRTHVRWSLRFLLLIYPSEDFMAYFERQTPAFLEVA